MPWGSVENGVTRVEEGFGNIASNVLRLFFLARRDTVRE